jgi:hypothetical protein
MYFEMLGIGVYVPSNVLVPFLAGISFVKSHVAPWALGVFFATLKLTSDKPGSRIPALIDFVVFISIGVLLMPALVALYSVITESDIHWAYGLALISSYCIAWILLDGRRKRK